MLSLNDYGTVWTQCDMDGFQIVGPPPSQMTRLILYLSDQLTACPSPWKRPSHPQGHTYCPPALPGHCPRNMSLSVCTWKSKAQVMSPLLTRVHYNWKPWPFTFHLSALRLISSQATIKDLPLLLVQLLLHGSYQDTDNWSLRKKWALFW